MEMMKVEEILQTVEGSVDFGSIWSYPGETDDEMRTNFWLDVIQSKSGDTGFINLVNSILNNGWAEGSCVGWWNNDITEGHHRLTAAILLGMDEVPVAYRGASRDAFSHVDAHHYGGEKVNFLAD